MDWVLFGAGITTFPILLCFKEQYRRSFIDKNCGLDTEVNDTSVDGEVSVENPRQRSKQNAIYVPLENDED